MRYGQNPAKSIQGVEKPQRITAAVLNYIPFLSGYYSEMKEILSACLQSLRQNSDLPLDLMVFDNGSCEEIRSFLNEEFAAGHIQYLILSEKNIGKGGAWNVMLQAAPGEIIAYTDGDIYFNPGWLSASVQILETYPKVGMVTGRPIHTLEPLYSSTVAWADSSPDVQVERGKLMDAGMMAEFWRGLGRTEEQIREDYEQSTDVRLAFKGVQAYAGASHLQFVAYKQTLQQFLPFDMDRPMGQVIRLDEQLNQQGYLRLMTTSPYIEHMGNSAAAIPGNMSVQSAGEKRASLRIVDFPPVKKVLMKLYHLIFGWYYRS